MQVARIDAAWILVKVNSTSEACVGNPIGSFEPYLEHGLEINETSRIQISREWTQKLAQYTLELQIPSLDEWFAASGGVVSPTAVTATFVMSLADIAYPFLDLGMPIPWGDSRSLAYLDVDLMYMELQPQPVLNVTTQAQLNLEEPSYQKYATYIASHAKAQANRYKRYFFVWDNSGSTEPSEQLETLSMISYRRGIGYSAATKTVRLSLAILGIYCFVTVLHMLWITSTGKDGNSWNSYSELVMLALNSRNPGRLIENTSVGVNTRQTFEELVSIRSNCELESERSVELAFRKLKHPHAAEILVEYNEEY